MAGRGLQAGDVLLVIHDFDARSGDELTLRRSERVQLIELDEGFNDGWYLGKHLTKGGTGLFPGVYTTKAPLATRSASHTPTNSTSYQAVTLSHHAPKLSIGTPASSAHHSVPAAPASDPASDASSFPAPHHTTYVQRTIGEALGEHEKGSDSPVMNETLHVIDEHITDLSTPRQSLPHSRHRGDDSESEYSSHLDRISFLAGPETDDEDSAGFDEATVRSWDHEQVAQQLANLGVDPKHCQIFKEQEISGDVLLDMDQNFVYMKEFDFGVMGRRLKTWHKIRDFQIDVKSHFPHSRASAGRSSGRAPSSSHSNLALRQAQETPPVAEENTDMPQPLQPTQSSKRTSLITPASPSAWRTTVGPEMSPRTNTSLPRRSRRHSSIDFGAQPDLELSSLSTASHNKQSSLDRSWSMAASTQATTPTSSTRLGGKTDELIPLASPPLITSSPLEIDRGYFSGNDMDSRKLRNRLSKSPRIGHTRQTSLAESSTSKRASMMKRHNRLSSVGSLREEEPTAHSRNLFVASTKKSRFRSSSARASIAPSPNIGSSPTVTNLENESNPSITAPSIEKMRMQDRARKFIGLRTTSDAVTPAEKSDAAKPAPSSDTARSSDLVASPATGDTTPSATPSLDIDTPDGTDASSALSKPSLRPRPKTKQHTSAYTHGLLKIPPSEARKTCDYHGWMKKKSSGLMTTWRPRLFILRGRRLSYYYSETDTEERGIIDISGHKVLVANDDPMVTIHASVTGALKSSSTPRPEAEASASTAKQPAPSGVFYFKLVPPKSGFSRAVQFTKPAVHYFQVDTIIDGRKWMGEIMKATIEHDLSNFESTNKQKTISLAKARARKERPPALDDTKAGDTDAVVQEENKADKTPGENGLGIDLPDSTVALDGAASGTTSPKALSMLGLGPKTSLKKKKVDGEKDLPTIPGDDDDENKENLENNDIAAVSGSADDEKIA